MSAIRPLVLGVDPGVLSGVALISRDGPKVLYSTETEWFETGQIVDSLLYHYGGENISVAVERYTITMETARKSPQPASLHVTGICMWLAQLRGSGAIKQYSPGDCKAMFPNDQLRRLDCWHKSGAGHARDAIRVGLFHLIRTHWTDSRMLQNNASN